jgi:uncharacterized damage-inducible protein DinB
MDLRFPIGEFEQPDALTAGEREAAILSIETHPAKLRAALADISEKELAARYRPGGWSVTQVVHHLADSHMNAYLRFKLALTEDVPTIKTYDEAAWAELPDVGATSIDVSRQLLEALHARWSRLLRAMQAEQTPFSRRLSHPERGAMNLDQMLALYAWHGPHHVAHIRLARGQGLAAAGG